MSWKKSTSWEYTLPRDEIPETLALGTGWCAVSTDANYIRFFSTEGNQTFILSTSLSVISMVGYENLLAVIVQNGVPCLSC